MPSNYTLVYFNARGRGEICRYLFAASNTKYTDQRVEFSDWAEEKKVSPQGTLPYLKVDGKHMIPQSLAIARYLAREFGFYGKSNLDAAKIDVFLDTTLELFDKGIKAFFEKDETTKKELIDDLNNTQAPKYLDIMERSACGFNGYLVGNRVSVADMYLYCVLENLQMMVQLDKYPNLQQSCKQVAENKRIKAYISTRPDTPF